MNSRYGPRSAVRTAQVKFSESENHTNKRKHCVSIATSPHHINTTHRTTHVENLESHVTPLQTVLYTRTSAHRIFAKYTYLHLIKMIQRNHAIILTMFLVAIVVIFFAWFLNRSCRRVIDVEVHEMNMARKAEAQKGKK